MTRRLGGWAVAGILALGALGAFGPQATQAQVLLPNAKQQFLDSNGNPLVGGSVYTYVPNTTTNKTTYSDQGLTTPNSNPIVLDGAGEAQIWASAGQTFREVVKDANGNTIWDGLTQTPGGINSTQSATGVVTGPMSLNLVDTTSDNAAVTDSDFGVLLNTYYRFGGSAMTGGREAIQGFSEMTAATASAGHTNRNYVGIDGIVQADTADNGTGTTKALAAGAFFAFAGQAYALSGATNLLDLTGGEVNVTAETGSSGWYKVGWDIVAQSLDAVAFTHNVMLGLGTQAPTTPTYDAAISINDFNNSSGGGNGSTGLTTSGCVLCGQSENSSLGTIATGIDLSKFTISGNFFNYANGFLTGSGLYQSFDNLAGAYPTPKASAPCLAIGNNFSSGSGEVDVFNCDETAVEAFRVSQQTGASATNTLLTISSAGNTTVNGNLTWGGTAAVVGAGEVSVGGTTVAGGSGTCPAGAAGCIVVNVAGTSRNVPFY